jgi:hypothetical protein
MQDGDKNNLGITSHVFSIDELKGDKMEVII